MPIGDPSHEVATDIIEGRITPKRDAYSDDPAHPVFLRAQNIEEGFLRFDDAKRLLPEAFAAEPKAILKDGDLVLTIDGVLLGKAAVHRPGDLPCCVSNHMVRIRHGSRISPEFLAAYLNGPSGQLQIKRGITGSAIPGLRTDAINRIVVPTPPPSKQREKLAFLEAARADRRRKLEEAASILEGLDSFILRLVGLDNLEFENRRVGAIRRREIQGPLNPERYLETSPAARLKPAQSVPLDQAFEVLEEKVTPLRDAPDLNWKCLRIDALGSEPLDPPQPEEVRGEDLVGSFFRVQDGDLLIARLGPPLLNGKIIVARSCSQRTVCSPEFLVLRPSRGYDPDVGMWILRSRAFRRVLYSKCRGSTPSRYRLIREELGGVLLPRLTDGQQKDILTEASRRLTAVRRLRADAAQLWDDSKRRFEEALLAASTEVET
jgi:hypothetical protein